MNELSTNEKLSFDAHLSCPSCGQSGIESRKVHHTFLYGEEPDGVELTAIVDARSCPSCGFEFLDDVAEDAKHEAICRHLCVLTPREIKAIRDRLGLSRHDFAQATKLGEATLGRWERGCVIQNGAYDQFLFLLTLPGNFQRMINRCKIEEAAKGRPSQTLDQSSLARFTALAAGGSFIEKSRAAKRFKLHIGEAA